MAVLGAGKGPLGPPFLTAFRRKVDFCRTTPSLFKAERLSPLSATSSPLCANPASRERSSRSCTCLAPHASTPHPRTSTQKCTTPPVLRLSHSLSLSLARSLTFALSRFRCPFLSLAMSLCLCLSISLSRAFALSLALAPWGNILSAKRRQASSQVTISQLRTKSTNT